MRLLIRCVVLCLVVSAAAVPAGARALPLAAPAAVVGETPPNPRATDQAGPVTPAALKARANQTAAKYAAAQTVYARLDDQVAALERQVADLETRIGPLRDRMTRQAVAVY